MNSFSLSFLCFALVTTGLFLPAAADAQGFGPSLRPHRPLDQQWRSQQRQLWRPNVRVVRAKGESRTLAAGASREISFSVKRGFVLRIELRSGLRLIRTLPLTGPAQSGSLSFTVPGGLNDLKIWAWQGQAGYQSVHGESIKYSLIP
jgi:hypothetical protein